MEKGNNQDIHKSILRNSSICSNNNVNSHSNMHVTFDEEVIKEHDKERGNKMVIDEPKTPFHYFDEEGNEIPPPKVDKRRSVDLTRLNSEVEEEKKKLGLDSSDVYSDEEETDEKTKKFLEKRKKHYANEFQGGLTKKDNKE